MGVKNRKGRGEAGAKDAVGADDLRSVLAIAGPELMSFSRPELHEAIQSRMKGTGVTDGKEYLSYLARNPQEIESLIAAVREEAEGAGIGPELYDALEKSVLPISVLHASVRGDGRIRVWTRGSPHPAVPYRVAILFLEMLEDVREHYAVEVLCTYDGRSTKFDGCAEGIKASDLSSMDQGTLEKYFARDGKLLRPGTVLSKTVKMLRTDPADGPWPVDVDLLVCLDAPAPTEHRALRMWIGMLNRSLKQGGLVFVSGEGTGLPVLPEHLRPIAAQPGLFLRSFPSFNDA